MPHPWYVNRDRSYRRNLEISRAEERELRDLQKKLYIPAPNDALTRPVHSSYGNEYLAIDRIGNRLADTALRNLFILSDTTIRFERIGSPQKLRFELAGDALFLFNSFSSHQNFEKPPEIMSYKDGFRPHSEKSHTVYFMRAVNALDAMSVESTGEILVERTNFGKGYKPSYRLYQDINRIDLRPSQ